MIWTGSLNVQLPCLNNVEELLESRRDQEAIVETLEAKEFSLTRG